VTTAGVADVLARIVERRRERLAEAAGPPPELPADLPIGQPRTAADNAFLAALAARPASRRFSVIAEVKMGSPRLGPLAGRVDPLGQARTYAANGAAALSVVVEPDFFFGSYDLLAACRRASGLPAIAKDFVVDPRQLVWAREAGADAVLLIASLYEAAELARYAGMARGVGLVPLVETHDAADLAMLAGGEWEIVGVNNRDLKTFGVELERSIALLPHFPAAAAGALRVAESGIDGRAAVERLARAGFDAFLVGESLLLAADPGAKLRELAG